MSDPVLAALGLFLCVTSVAVAIVEYRRTHELLTPLTLFAALAIIDVFGPALLYGLLGGPTLAPWLDSARVTQHMSLAVVLYAAGAAFFIGGYVLAHRGPFPWARRPASGLELPPPRFRFVWAVAMVAIVGYVWAIWQRSLEQKVSLLDYFANGLVVRYIPLGPQEQYASRTLGELVLLQAGLTMLPVFMLCVGVLFYWRRRSPLAYGVVAPALASLVAMTTFYRGTVLGLFVALFVLIELTPVSWTRPDATWIERLLPRLVVAVVGVSLFLSFGTIRDAASYAAQRQRQVVLPSATVPPPATQTSISTPVATAPPAPASPATAAPTAGVSALAPDVARDAIANQLRRVVIGEGLIGIASIVTYYPDPLPYLNGKTIRDMLLLPVPRAIWHDKPSWYGIADITRAMGEPVTTQSAVTMPGELYANFGVFGVIGCVGYGLIFGAFHAVRSGRRMRFFYAIAMQHLLFLTSWMAMTGFMNSVVYLAPAALSLFVLFPPNMPERVGGWSGVLRRSRLAVER